MSAASDVKNLMVQESSNPQKVPVDHLDYKYITNCTSTKELSRILRSLRSGEEGYYPDLIRHCEERIETLDPKSRALRKDKPILQHGDLRSDEASSIKEDLDTFINSTKLKDSSIRNAATLDDDMPPVRGFSSVNTKGKKTMVNGKGDSKSKDKLKSWDYKGWDKFDVDKECEKVEEEESETSEQQTSQVKPKIRHALNTANMSDEEKETRAIREKDKGNEAFKSGDMEEAIAYYTRSISLHPLAAAINNRALAYLKMKNWQRAEEDCNDVLSMSGESENIKAYLRRATAYSHLDKYQNAFKDLTFVLEKEPNNAKAKSLLTEVEEELEKIEKNKPPPKGKKMTIVEVEESSDEEVILEEGSGTNVEQNEDSKPASILQKSNVSVTKQEISSKAQSTSSNEAGENANVKNLAGVKTESVKPEEPEPLPVNPLPAHIDNLKKAGGNSFKIGQYADALQHYTKAINTLLKFCEGSKEKQKNYLHGRAILHNNRAACYLKSGNDVKCIKDCKVVLEIKPWDYKALTRRGCAYEHMEKYKMAYVDFKSALSMNWNDAFLTASCNRIANHLRDLDGPQWRDKLPEILVYSAPSVTQKPVLSIKDDPNLNTVKEPMQSNVVKNVPEATSKQPEHREESDKVKAKSEAIPRTTQQKTKEEEMAEKKEQIRRSVFDKLKLDGNNFVKKGKYEEAIECYTKCMTMCPAEPASYTNRALCFLKLNKPISAVNDCTKAIELDPRNVKAYFRRATARKSEKFYKDAEDDLNALLKIEPGNTLAKKELKTVKNLRAKALITPKSKPAEKTKSVPTQLPSKPKEVQKPKKKMLIEEVSSSEDEDNTKDKVQPKETPKQENLPTTSKTQSKAKTQESTPEVKTSKTVSDEEIIHQPYEFGHQWNAVPIKDIPKYKDILDRIIPTDLPRLLSNKTDDHVINVVALVCKDYITSGEEGRGRALKLMQGLASADRFTMAGMFMSDKQKNNVKSTIQLFKDEKLVNELLHLYKDVL